jgi:hypothetical protein
MDRIKDQQMGGTDRITAGIIDMHQLDAGSPPEGPKHQPADAAEAVDADFHGRGAGQWAES